MPSERSGSARENVGRLGETAAAEYLTCRGYRLLCRNYKRGRGEIDLIMTDGEYLVFVEVKTRREGYWVSPLEAVTQDKRGRIVQTAQQYLSEHPCALQPRFDVVQVFCSRYGQFRVERLEHLENAFSA